MLAQVIWCSSLAWLIGTTILALLQPWRRRLTADGVATEAVSIIVPTCAIDSPRSREERERALTSLLDVAYPAYEIIVCIDRQHEDRSVRDRVERLFGPKGVRTAAAARAASPNAKIDAMAAGLDQAANDILLFCDDDVTVEPGHLRHLVAGLHRRARLVSAAAIGVQAENLWGHLECSFMNGQFARLHLAGDCVGVSGALGKTVMIRRDDVRQLGGLLPAGTDCCEDAALTRMVKRAGGSIALSAAPVRQTIRKQSLAGVVRRHRRWLSCRRKYLLPLFLAEGAFSTAIAAMAGGVVAQDLWGRPAAGVAATLLLWGSFECVFAAAHRYLSLLTPVAWFVREAIFLPLWLSALVARTATWYGRRVPV